MRLRILVAIIAGVVIGILTTRYLFVGSSLGIIPWAIGGLSLGAWSINRKQATILGGVYGFFVLFSFMFGGYQGSYSLVSRILPFALLGLFGAIGGIVATQVGIFFHRDSHSK